MPLPLPPPLLLLATALVLLAPSTARCLSRYQLNLLQQRPTQERDQRL